MYFKVWTHDSRHKNLSPKITSSRIKNCTVHDSKSSASQKLDPRIPKILNAASCQKYLEFVVYYIFLKLSSTVTKLMLFSGRKKIKEKKISNILIFWLTFFQNKSAIHNGSVPDPWHFGTDPIRGSIPLTNGSESGFGSCSFRLWPSKRQ